MRLTAWNVWHSYSTYLDRPITNLDQAARRLVDSCLAEVAVTSSGGLCWRDNEQTRVGRLEIDRHPYKADATIALPEGISGYAATCAFDAALYGIA